MRVQALGRIEEGLSLLAIVMCSHWLPSKDGGVYGMAGMQQAIQLVWCPKCSKDFLQYLWHPSTKLELEFFLMLGGSLEAFFYLRTRSLIY